jgi:5,10-methylenetetrahydromethanopterin reductase
MLHPAGHGAPRPVDVPVLIGVGGPKGVAVAAELGAGVLCAGSVTRGSEAFDDVSVLTFGTVLEPGEDPASERVRAAAGHGVAVAYHAVYERRGEAVDSFPGGEAWRRAVESVPVERRHLAIHEGHLIAPNERDLLALDADPSLAASLTVTGTPDDVRSRIDALATRGATEVAYQPAGPDIPRELEAFAAAVRSGS